MTSQSRGADRARVLLEARPPEKQRAQGRPGARCTRGLVCNSAQKTHTSIQVQRRQSGIPCAMVYGLFRALPGDRAFLPPSPALLSANLTPASGCQDHTTLPSASCAFVKGAIHVHRIPPHVCDDHETPLMPRRDGGGYRLIWVFGKSEYFFKRGWTRGAINCPGDLPVGQ